MVYTPPAMLPPDATTVMGRRITAWLLDLVIFLAVVLASFAAFAEFVEVPEGRDPAAVCDQLEADFPSEAASCLSFGDGDGGRVYVLSDDDAAAQTVVSFAYFAFFVVLQGLTGGSPGKLVTGIRVVDKMGTKAGVGRSLGRTLLWIVDSAPYVLPLVGFIAGLTTPGHRRVGDLAAGTYVVRRHAVGAPVLPVVASPPPGQPAWGLPTPGAPPGPGPFGVPTDTGPGASVPIPDWTTPPDSTPPSWDPSSTPEVAAPVWEPPTAPSTPTWEPPEAPAWESPTSPPPSSGADVPNTPDVGAAGGAAGESADAPAVAFPPPQWDPARNTYLQWDPTRKAWLQWDTNANRWKPIDT